MSEKYTGLIGRWHLWKEAAKEKWAGVKEVGGIKEKTNDLKEEVIRKINHGDDQYDHLYR